MTKQNIIKHLYKKYPSPATDREDLNLSQLLNENLSQHDISVGEENIIINSIDEESPLREIPIRNITGIEDFERYTVIILRNSILFIDKQSDDIHVHINVEQPSLWQRLKNYFSDNEF